MSEYVPTVEAFRGVYGQMCAAWCRDDALAEFDRFIARIKAEAVAEALRELLGDVTSVKDEYGHLEGFVPEWAVRDEIDRIEKGER